MSSQRNFLGLSIFLFLLLLGIVDKVPTSGETPKEEKPTQPAKIDFAHDIVPIIKARCAECHTNGTYKGSLSMDTREDMLKAKVVFPGESGKSELFKRITSKEKQDRMPPKGKPLTAKEVALFKTWIDQDLPWETGFTFKKSQYLAKLKPRRPKLPPARPGLEHPIDRLLFVYYQQHNIKPPAPADDVAFIRRAYLDVIGLLPTPEEVQAFVKEDTNKRDKLVKHLLNQRRAYTEHWLTFWNDLLRNDYSGTGYIDGGRKQISSWLYRSLHENKPYDQFVRELIKPTAESAGFIRGIKWRGNVNASQVPEIQFSQNVSLVFFGANMKCASCHDSFVDSWKLKDAYGMAAVVATRKLEIHRCDKPTGKFAQPKFLWPELGQIDPKLSQPQRLEQLAKLVTHKDNGRFTRTIVNRLWQRFMGRGLVHPVDVMANPPWNEDLLDYLAVYLSDNNYDLKKLMEHILTSRAYQAQAAIQTKETPGQEYLFHGPELKRMTAEQFVDAIWQLTGTSPRKAHAPVSLPRFDPGTPKDRQFLRASLMRSNLLMRSLGRPNREQVVTTRGAVLTTLQALDLANNQTLYDYLMRGGTNLLKNNPGATSEEIVEQIYLHALSRPPTDKERTTAEQIVGTPPSREGVADLLWCVVMLPEFQLVR